MKLSITLVVMLAMLIMVQAFPSFWGTRHGKCGQVPKKSFGAHKKPLKDKSTKVTLTAGGKKTKCYKPGAKHTVQIKFKKARAGFIYLSGGKFSGSGASGNGALPAGLCGNKRRNIGYKGSSFKPGKSFKYSWTAPKSGKVKLQMTSASGSTDNFNVVTKTLKAC